MSILAIFDVPGMTSAQYDQIITDLEEPDGRISHVSAPKEGGWIVIDVWESEEHLTKFSERLIPVMQSAGVTLIEPQIYQVHNQWSMRIGWGE